MKSVLISIQPKWVEKIASGEKTIEVRKTRPKIETPFKCYIYCTIGNGVKGDYLVPSNIQCGKVIGEFVCDEIGLAYWTDITDSSESNEGYLMPCMGEDCLSYEELCEYGKGKDLYLWHISNLKIYDKPKELSEFSSYSPEYTVKDGSKYDRVLVNPLKRPPQSWCYVESLGE